MTLPAGGTLGLLQTRFVQVAYTAGQLLARGALQLPEDRPVAVVVLLHDLEGPVTRDHIAADQVPVDPGGYGVVASLAQGGHRVAELDVGRPGQLVERVQVAAGPLAGLQRLDSLPSASTVASVTPLGRLPPRQILLGTLLIASRPRQPTVGGPVRPRCLGPSRAILLAS